MDLDPADRLVPAQNDPSSHTNQTKPAPPQSSRKTSTPLARAKHAFEKTGQYAYTSVRRVDASDEPDREFPNQGRVPNGDVQSRKLWVPFFLRRPAILSFFIIFFAILWSLVGLYIYSSRNGGREGLITDDAKYYYVWTFGPAGGMTFLIVDESCTTKWF